MENKPILRVIVDGLGRGSSTFYLYDDDETDSLDEMLTDIEERIHELTCSCILRT